MFTGLIESVGTVARIERRAGGARLTVAVAWAEELRLGESVAVNGACLTVAWRGSGLWAADLSAETLRRTTLGRLQVGDRLHLERALRVGDRLGGHLVQGHVDEVGMIRELRPEGAGMWMEIAVSPENHRYLAEKGSVAVDGVSLTVAALTPTGFGVALIPHTLERTTFTERRPGEPVNLEYDVLAKYVERMLTIGDPSTDRGSGLSLEFLKEHGFLS
ncbi:MAG: riboflavin synthase subunit alpha [Candidatus Poribacteria bacterium]|nr:MAG: riboflavin synthase subunit alpha [Candidatus Poribacteria bacterium]